jgi:hypothetical protein
LSRSKVLNMTDYLTSEEFGLGFAGELSVVDADPSAKIC